MGRVARPGPALGDLTEDDAGAILRAVHDPAFDAERYDRERAERYARREGLY